MSIEKHKRLEELKELLNFKDDSAFYMYSNGYKQGELDCQTRIETLEEALHLILVQRENFSDDAANNIYEIATEALESDTE